MNEPDPLADLMLEEANEHEAERETRRAVEARLHAVETRLDIAIELLKRLVDKPAHTDMNGTDLGARNIEVLERDGQDRIKTIRVR
jgi:hypothetical protein